MKVYLVGGAVRDHLLGRPVKDRDYVVVGSSSAEMLALGYEQVGADFPVFLHPVSREEHALARTERKVGQGYHGFVVNADASVTLEDDLRRRDLTINAMAQDLETGELIDPFNGLKDLHNGTLRHVSEAFAEDPLRVLRVARFAARFDFDVASTTEELMAELVNKGEMKALTAERVWLELEKALMEKHVTRFFQVLDLVGAWDSLFTEVNTQGILHRLRVASERNLSFDERVAAMLTATYLTKADNLLARYKAPADTIRLVHNVWKSQVAFNTMSMTEDKAHVALELMKSCDAYRRSLSFKQTLNVMSLLALPNRYEKFVNDMRTAYEVTANISFDALPSEEAQKLRGAEIGRAIDALRLAELEHCFKFAA
jgi:tRNA nucleotidyltransferase (CCA-adding enzyme)